MSDSEKNDQAKIEEGEKVITPPAISLPPPDDFDKKSTDSSVANARARAKAEKAARRKKKKGGERSHPLDSYTPLKKSGGSKGCFGCGLLLLVFLVLAVGGIAGYLYWWAIMPYQNAGYEVVKKTDSSIITVITEAPEVESLILIPQVEYLAPTTPKDIVFVCETATLAGVFEEKVVFRGKKLIIESGTIFRKDLEVYAAEMIDRGATVEGEILGSVMSQRQETADETSATSAGDAPKTSE